MAQRLNPPLLVDVDTNVALDFAGAREVVIDSITTIRERIGQGAICVTPTVLVELAHAADFGEPEKKCA